MQLDLSFWGIQAVGFIGLIFVVISFQGRTRNKILKNQAISAVFYMLHFYLLGAFTGAGINTVIAIRNFVFEKKDKKTWASSQWWIYVFILFGGIFSYLSWQGWTSLLPFTGMVVGTFARWQDKPILIRVLSLIGSSLWLVYGILVVSYPGIVTEVIVITSIVIGLFRFDLNKKYIQSRTVK